MAIFTNLLARTDLLLYFTTCIVIFLYWISRSKRGKGKMPPGPRPLPFIGNLHQLDLSKPYESLMKLSEEYGEVFTIHFGPKETVVIAGYNAVKEALINQAEAFGERAVTPLFKLISKEKGIVFSNGEPWKATRRFALATLRDFGMGKKTMETKIQEELVPLIEKFKSYNGQPFDTDLIVNRAVSNVICSVIFGERFDYEDPVFKKLVHIISQNEKMAGSPKLFIFDFFPRISTLLGTHKKLMQNLNEMMEFVLKRIKKNRQEFDANDISGFIDAYLLKQASGKPEIYFDDENLAYSVMDLFGAGTETTSTTLRWGILLMMKYPEIQKKVQEEIRLNVKQGQMPTVEDRRNMPYTEAVVHELQRFANIAPLNVLHRTASDINFRGYCIPKGTEVIPFLTSVLHDKTQWKTPNEFNPNHFLDANGKFVKHDAFMPFSAGRRSCVGESLAKMEVFLFFTGLLQAFTFHPPPGVRREDLSLKAGTGFILCPLPHLVCAKPNY